MNKEDIRRYLPVGVFASLSSIIIADIGAALNFWALRENIVLLKGVFPYHLGAAPVITMWIFKFTFGNFGRYIMVDALINVVFAFLWIPFMVARGIREMINANELETFLILTGHGIILYIYQLWIEGYKLEFRTFALGTAAAKPRLDDNKTQD